VAKQRGGGGGPDPTRRPTKAERKEEARLERETTLQRMAARRRNRTLAMVVGAILVVAVVAVVALSAEDSGGPTADATAPGALPGLLTTDPPWPANTDQLADRLAVLDLPPEGTAEHLHVPLYVYVDGEQVTVPANLGLSQAGVSPLHTHDELGTVHVESAVAVDFTLGQFFDVWGVRLTADCVGGDCADAERALRVYSGGEEVTGNPRDVVLEDSSAVVVTMGTEDQVPDPVPTGFPSGDGAP
jgi:hypothetical protein